MVVLTLVLLGLQTAPSAHAQGRMGMMMGRQMMMNGGTMGVNGLTFNPLLARGRGWGLYSDLGYGYGLYGEGYPTEYSSQDNSNSKHKIRKYQIEEPTLSPEEERERTRQIELAWSQGDLSELESQTATALNILLDDLRDLQSKGIQAPDMTLDSGSLGRLNVLVNRTNGNPGVLRNNGQFDWPTILQGPEFQSERKSINRLAPRVIEQAREGQVTDLPTFAGAVEKMHQTLHTKIADTAPPTYIRANRFLTQLEDAIKILRQPDAGNYFNQIYSARGNTVRELVRYMTRLDLHFAPALEGDASAYHALHQVLAAYDRSAHEPTMSNNHRIQTAYRK
jgi:hypothetical protein